MRIMGHSHAIPEDEVKSALENGRVQEVIASTTHTVRVADGSDNMVSTSSCFARLSSI